MANRYFVTGSGGNNNWGTSGAGSNWSLTDGGAGGQTVPGSGDDVFFTANSPNCTVDTTTRSTLSLNFTGYTNTITMTNEIDASASITFSATMTIAGSAYIRGIGTGTHTSNGKTIPNFWLSGSITHTIADNFTVGNLRMGSTSNTTVVSGNQISVTGNFDRSVASSGNHNGNTTIIMTGTGSILLPSAGSVLSNPLVINTSGTITFPTGIFRINGSFTYTAGTVSNSTNTEILIGGTSATYTVSSAIQFNNFTWSNAASVTLTIIGDLYVLDLAISTNGSSNVATIDFTGYNIYCRDLIHTVTTSGTFTFTGNNLYISRNFSSSMTSGTLGGSATIIMTGTGSFTTNAHTTGRIISPVVLQGPVITLVSAVGVCNLNFYKFKHLPGKVIANSTWGIYPEHMGGSF